MIMVREQQEVTLILSIFPHLLKCQNTTEEFSLLYLHYEVYSKMSNDFIEPIRAEVLEDCREEVVQWEGESSKLLCNRMGRISCTWKLTGKRDELRLEEFSEQGEEQ